MPHRRRNDSKKLRRDDENNPPVSSVLTSGDPSAYNPPHRHATTGSNRRSHAPEHHRRDAPLTKKEARSTQRKRSPTADSAMTAVTSTTTATPAKSRSFLKASTNRSSFDRIAPTSPTSKQLIQSVIKKKQVPFGDPVKSMAGQKDVESSRPVGGRPVVVAVGNMDDTHGEPDSTRHIYSNVDKIQQPAGPKSSAPLKHCPIVPSKKTPWFAKKKSSFAKMKKATTSIGVDTSMTVTATATITVSPGHIEDQSVLVESKKSSPSNSKRTNKSWGRKFKSLLKRPCVIASIILSLFVVILVLIIVLVAVLATSGAKASPAAATCSVADREASIFYYGIDLTGDCTNATFGDYQSARVEDCSRVIDDL